MERSCLSYLVPVLAIVLSLAVTRGVGAAEQPETQSLLSPNQRAAKSEGTPAAQTNEGFLSRSIDPREDVRVSHILAENKRIELENAELAKKVSDCEIEIEIIVGNCSAMKNTDQH